MMEKKKAKIKDALSFTKAGEAFNRLEAERDELISDMDMLAKQRDDSWRRLSIVEDQRDELLAALKETVGDLFYQIESKHGPKSASEYPSVVKAKASIAKCEVKS